MLYALRIVGKRDGLCVRKRPSYRVTHPGDVSRWIVYELSVFNKEANL